MEDRKDTELRVTRRSARLTGRAGVTRVEKHHALQPQQTTHPARSAAGQNLDLYTWIPIDRDRKEIRILDLEAGDGNSPLQGRLRHIFLGGPEVPKYEAISYAWGATALVNNIWIGDKSIPIPASAGSALRSMRSPEKTLTFWIDCVCIDQKNDREKGHQVGMMADIFQSSFYTTAHLGDDDDNTAKSAFAGIHMIYRALQESTGFKDVPDYYDVELEDWCLLREQIDLVAIKAIMMKPYFRRLWILQEALLSPWTVLCYNHVAMGLNILVSVVSWLFFSAPGFRNEEFGERSLFAPAASFLKMTRFATKPEQSSLAFILDAGATLQCSDPRDRVFGLISLLRMSARSLPLELAPDYTKSVIDVYCDATRYCLGECDGRYSLEWFGYERSVDSMIEGLPSWVPSWFCYTETGRGVDAPELPKHTQIWPRICCETITPFTPGMRGNRVLTMEGVVLETISKHSNTLLTANITTSYIFIHQACDFVSGGTTPEGTDLSEANDNLKRLEHILSAGRDNVKVMESWLQYLPFLFSGMQYETPLITQLKQAFRLDDKQSDDLDRGPQEVSVPWIKAMEEAMNEFRVAIKYCQDRKVFLTHFGLLGIGPRTLQEGDVIAVSTLSQWPMILRRAEHEGPDHYTMIGQAFVEGVKEGEEVFAKATQGEGIGMIHLV